MWDMMYPYVFHMVGRDSLSRQVDEADTTRRSKRIWCITSGTLLIHVCFIRWTWLVYTHTNQSQRDTTRAYTRTLDSMNRQLRDDPKTSCIISGTWLIHMCFIRGTWLVYTHTHQSQRDTTRAYTRTPESINRQLRDDQKAMVHWMWDVRHDAFICSLYVRHDSFIPIHIRVHQSGTTRWSKSCSAGASVWMTHTDTHIDTRTDTYTHADTHIHTHAHTQADTHIDTHTYKRARAHTHTRACTRIHTHWERESEIQRERERERERDKCTSTCI